MSQRIQQFEEECQAFGVKPVQALAQANLHRSLWWKWRSGKVSPTLDKFEAAERGLKEIVAVRRLPDGVIATSSHDNGGIATDKSTALVGQPAGELIGGAE